MGKLVRDRIPEIIEEDGKEPVTRKLSETDREKHLREKIIEEAEEFAEDGSLEEAADVLQVLKSYVSLKDEDWEEVERKMRNKESERGGFEEGIFLEEVK